MCGLDEAWNYVTSFLTDNVGFPEVDKYCSQVFPECLVSSLQILVEADLAYVLYDWLIDEVRQIVSGKIKPNFWSNFDVSISENDVVDRVPICFSELYHNINTFTPWFQKLQSLQRFMNSSKAETCLESFYSTIHLYLRSIIFHDSNDNFDNAFKKYLELSLVAFDSCRNNQKSSERGLFEKSSHNRCLNCHHEQSSCICQKIFEDFKTLLKQLDNLELLEVVAVKPIICFIHEKIVSHVESQCTLYFEKSYVDTFSNWIHDNIVKWLDELLTVTFGFNHTSIKLIPPLIERLQLFANTIYGKLRIEQLFNIIIDFPESQPVLQDLVVCLNNVPELKRILVKSLKAALQRRLLHPGVNTSDILTAYISTMRALRVLDQSGVLLEMVGDPVKKYLRGRDDTVRCIVTSLTEDNNHELAEELNKGRLLSDDDSGDESSNSDNWMLWEPDPVEAEPLKPSPASRSFDIISMLINIYGSKELFIEEYRSLLADRILMQLSYDTDRDIRHLELLKLRFGETQLHQCEVMLKDVSDSRRINLQISERKEGIEQGDDIPVNAMILSAQFWPPGLRDENVKLPSCFVKSLESYNNSFKLLKGNRTLYWKPHLGFVDMEIELNGKVQEFKVSPIHAAIIWHFQEKPRYTLEELRKLLEMPVQALQRKISYWQSQGLLKEEGSDTYVLVDELKSLHHETMSVEEECAESVLVSAQDQKNEEIQTIWSYIAGMLTNLESLPLERIHSMLKMFAMQGPGSQCSIIELKNILETKIKELKLVYTNGFYRLNSTQ